MTLPSPALGFELAFAVRYGKPSLYLYYQETLDTPKEPIKGNPSRLITIKSYTEKIIRRSYLITL